MQCVHKTIDMEQLENDYKGDMSYPRKPKFWLLSRETNTTRFGGERVRRVQQPHDCSPDTENESSEHQLIVP